MLQNPELYAVQSPSNARAIGISANAALLLLLNQIFLGLNLLRPLRPTAIVDSVPMFRVSDFGQRGIQNAGRNSGATTADDRFVELDVVAVEVELQLIGGHERLLSRVEDMVEGDVCRAGHVARREA